MTPPHRCSGCDATWTGARAAHCGGCHRTFSGLGHFDAHRSAVGPHGKCIDPEQITTSDGKPAMFFRDGMWRGPEMTEETKEARFGSAP